MIAKIWLQIAAVLIISLGPVIYFQDIATRNSLNQVTAIAKGILPTHTLDSYMDLLKELRHELPENADRYKKAFLEAANQRRAIEDFQLAESMIRENLQTQTIWLIIAVCGMSLIISLLISYSIVGKFRILLRQQELALLRLHEIDTLKSWQTTARSVVHEIKGPLTPIKLIASSLVEKHEQLTSLKFKEFLDRSADLLMQQVKNLDSLLSSFTKFGKLPEANPKLTEIRPYFSAIKKSLSERYKCKSKIDVIFKRKDYSPTCLDQSLIENLIIILTNNAFESNKNAVINITITIDQSKYTTVIEVSNHGNLIPIDMEKNIFNAYVSSKSNKDNGDNNMGLGLTIAKKIALDHGGNIILKSNNSTDGVCFRIEIPNAAREGTI